ncbi:hypothetical protein Tco_1414348 [Tanacetum coccineum]
MKRSIDDVSNTILHANKKPAFRSNPTPHEQRRDRRDRVREEQNNILHANKKLVFRSNPTPREQHRDRRDRVREEHNKVREKDRIIDQKQSKKREREEEVDSIKGRVESKLSNKLLKATHSPIQVAAIPLGCNSAI